MGVRAFLPGLNFDEDRVLQTTLLCLLLIQLHSLVDIATVIHIVEFDTSGHRKLRLEVLWQSFYKLLHLLIEIEAITDFQYVAHFIHDLYFILSTKRFQALLICLKSLLALFINIDVSCHFLNHQFHAILLSIWIKVVMKVDWNAFEMWPVYQHGVQDGL